MLLKGSSNQAFYKRIHFKDRFGHFELRGCLEARYEFQGWITRDESRLILWKSNLSLTSNLSIMTGQQ